MLRIVVYVNETKIDEIHVLNMEKALTPGFAKYLVTDVSTMKQGTISHKRSRGARFLCWLVFGHLVNMAENDKQI